MNSMRGERERLAKKGNRKEDKAGRKKSEWLRKEDRKELSVLMEKSRKEDTMQETRKCKAKRMIGNGVSGWRPERWWNWIIKDVTKQYKAKQMQAAYSRYVEFD